MPKCINLTKYYRDRHLLQSGLRIESFRNRRVHSKKYSFIAGGGGGRPDCPGRPPRPKRLRNEWHRRIIDVCGLGIFSRIQQRIVYITHLHRDHLPLKEYVAGANLKFCTGPRYVKLLQEKYRDFEVIEYTDVVEVEHTYPYAGRYRVTKTYVFFIGDGIIIPECDNPSEVIREYEAKVTLVFVSQQSHNHLSNFNNRRDDVYILDNRTWERNKPNIIPKIVFSSTDEDRRLYLEYAQKCHPKILLNLSFG